MANVIKHKRGSGSDPSASDLVVGELAIRTDNGKLFTKMDSGAIAEIAGGGSDIAINTLSSSSGTGGGSATFNGSAYRFTLSSPPSVSAQQLLVSINGVIQKPVAGTGQPSEGFSVDGNDIILGDAPATGADFFILTFRSLGVSVPADNSVTSAKIADGAIVNADINASAAIAGTKISPDFGSQNISTTGRVLLGTTTEGFADADDLTIATSGNTGMTIRSGTTSYSSIFFSDATSGSGEYDGFIQYNHNTQKLTVGTGATGSSDFAIDSSGNIGIGTTSPDGKLDVRGTIFVNGDGTGGRIFASSGNLSLSDGNGRQVLRIDDPGAGNSHNHIFDSNGRLGIGTTSPSTGLEITSGMNSDGLSILKGSNSSVFLGHNGSGDEGLLQLKDGGTTTIQIYGETGQPSFFNAGNVGIGTTSPRSLLDLGTGADASTVSNTAADYQLGLHAAQSTQGDIGRNIGFISQTVGTVTAAINSIDFGGSDSTGLVFLTGNASSIDRRMTIDSSGRVLIGINSAASGINASSDDLVVGNYNENINHGITIGSNTNGSIRFADNASGGAGIIQFIHGTTNQFKMQANTAYASNGVLTLVKPNGPSDAATTMLTFESGGQARGQIKSSSSDSGSPSFASYSDYRMKENIRDYTDGWNNIKAVPVKLFDVKTDGSKDQKGWIAHELQAVLPDLVQGAKDAVVTQAMVDNEESDEKELGNPIYQTVSMGLFMPDVISALQTAIAKIETLEIKVAALEAG